MFSQNGPEWPQNLSNLRKILGEGHLHCPQLGLCAFAASSLRLRWPHLTKMQPPTKIASLAFLLRTPMAISL